MYHETKRETDLFGRIARLNNDDMSDENVELLNDVRTMKAIGHTYSNPEFFDRAENILCVIESYNKGKTQND